MTVPNYMVTFRRALQKQEELATRARGRDEINEVNEISPQLSGLNSLNSFNSYHPGLYADALSALEARCPDYIEPNRWQQCIADARRFLSEWGEQAHALGWTADDLFGLHEPSAKPHPSYRRLSRCDSTGLIWGLEGSPVVAMTETTAAVQNSTTGNVLTHRRFNRPALGPFGDSLDDYK